MEKVTARFSMPAGGRGAGLSVTFGMTGDARKYEECDLTVSMVWRESTKLDTSCSVGIGEIPIPYPVAARPLIGVNPCMRSELRR